MKTLLRYDCPGLDDEDVDGWAPLAWALNNSNCLGLVEELLSTQQVKVDRRDKGRRTPLLWATSYGYHTTLTLSRFY